MKAKILIPVFVVAVIATAALGAANTFAQSETSPHDSIVGKMVQKFGLNEAEVKAVFEEERTERQAEMQTKFEERLNSAVSEGTITEEQKQIILTKHKELQGQRQAEKDSMENLTQEERREKMETRHEEMEAWAEENGIDMENFMGFKGGMKGGWHAK